MINENNVYVKLDLSTAIGNQIALAKSVGITVQNGSVENVLANWLAQFDIYMDTKQFQSYQLEFNPVGSDIDLQNPGNPRLQAAVANGYLYLTNATVDPIEVLINSIFTAPNGNQYTTGNNSVVVPVGSPVGTATIAVSSVETGIDQNLPSLQEFESDYDLTATNPQPFTDGRDVETDTQYSSRIIYLQTNNSSQQATAAALKELLQYYSMAQIYVNSNSTDNPDPVPIPANGYLAIVNTPSAQYAGQEEIAKAIQILAARFEFVDSNNNPTTTHPILGGTVYTGPLPESFYFGPAQAVKTTINAEMSVSFNPNIDDSEKNILAVAFASFFAQNIVNYFGGAAGNATCTFNPSEGDPIETAMPILANKGILADTNPIGPAFSIEQVRALISDESDLTQIENLIYESCDVLTMELDPQLDGEPLYTLSIDAPSGGTISNINFKTTALFTDYTSWYDRYVYIDPTLITITVNEV